MTEVVYVPFRPFVVETGWVIENLQGERSPGRWNFHYAFDKQADAIAAADRLAEDNEFVRVVENKERNK